MRSQLQESKAQRWRALAKFNDVEKFPDGCLVFVGTSFSHVSENYEEAFEGLTEDERKSTISITLQKFVGAPDKGHWSDQKDLPIPDIAPLKIGVRKDGSQPSI